MSACEQIGAGVWGHAWSITVFATPTKLWEITPPRGTFPQAGAPGGGNGPHAVERDHRSRRMQRRDTCRSVRCCRA